MKVNPEGGGVVGCGIRLVCAVRPSTAAYVYITSMSDTAILSNHELYITAERSIPSP